MAGAAIAIRIRLPGKDTGPDLRPTPGTPGSDEGYTFHHILPWRLCVAVGDLLLKLAVYGDRLGHQPRFPASEAAPLPQESVGTLFDTAGEATKRRLVDAASGLMQAGALGRHTDLTRHLRGRADGGPAVAGWLAWHAGTTEQHNIAPFARPPFAGFWGMRPQLRADDPGGAPEPNLPLSLPGEKASRLTAFVAAASAVFGGIPAAGATLLVATRADLVLGLLAALEPLVARFNAVHPFEPSDWTYRLKGDRSFREPWWFATAEEVRRHRPHETMMPSTDCRDRSFALRLPGEGVTGARLDPALLAGAKALPRPLVWNMAGTDVGGRARFCVFA